MPDEQAQPGNQQICPRCGSAFTCGLQAGQESCWCFKLPHLITVENTPRQGCLCPSCLGQLIEQIQQQEKKESSSPE